MIKHGLKIIKQWFMKITISGQVQFVIKLYRSELMTHNISVYNDIILYDWAFTSDNASKFQCIQYAR